MQEVSSAIKQMRFPQKLWYLLDLHTDAILWGLTGRTILLNYRVLHTYLRCNHSIFKTTNISSFVRQLNLYGFRKVTSHLQDPLCNSSNPYMHEYMHDYFQFDRPELLNKITRNALTMKKNFKVKNILGNTDQLLNMTPLQKARRALQIALKKAVQNVYSQDTTKQYYQSEFDDEQEDFQEEESFDVDWIPGESPFKSIKHINIPQPAIETSTAIVPTEAHNTVETDSMVKQEGHINFSDDSNRQTNDNDPVHFLNMPDLDSEPIEENAGIELLAEFNINSNMDQGIIKKKNMKDSSLNCVLPSVSNDDITFVESNADNHYNREWDQMFSDMMTNKNSSQDSVSNLKELYSQISQTIDLLNS